MTVHHTATGSSVTYSPTVAIRVRYLGPTNVTGARFRVFRADGTYNEDPYRLTVNYDHGLSHADRAADCVRRYLEQKGDGWTGAWTVAGASDTEYIAVRVES